MTIGAALTKLMKYAKVFTSEKVGGGMVEFVDPVIYKYIADEFCEAVAEVDQTRKHLQLADECCEQVLQSDVFSHAVTTWQRSDEPDDQISFLARPQSVNDADGATIQLKEFNKDLISIIRACLKSVKDVRSWREQAAGMAVSDPSRVNYQVAADAEADTIEHKREQVRAHYARWCPYMQRFCEAWSMFGKEVDDR
jgi:hypothetical protein